MRNEEDPKLARLYLAIELYREREVSLGKAAESLEIVVLNLDSLITV